MSSISPTPSVVCRECQRPSPRWTSLSGDKPLCQLLELRSHTGHNSEDIWCFHTFGSIQSIPMTRKRVYSFYSTCPGCHWIESSRIESNSTLVLAHITILYPSPSIHPHQPQCPYVQSLSPFSFLSFFLSFPFLSLPSLSLSLYSIPISLSPIQPHPVTVTVSAF